MVVDGKNIYVKMRRWSMSRANNTIVEEEGINKLRGRRENVKIVKEGIKKLRRKIIKLWGRE